MKLKIENNISKSMFNLEIKLDKNIFKLLGDDLHNDLLIIFDELEYLDKNILKLIF